MKSPRITRNIKRKMLIGIFLVVCAFIAAGIFTYRSFNQMIQAMDTLSQPEAKLVHLNEVMTEVSNAEGSARAYTLTKEQHYLRNYWEQFSDIEARIQELRKDMQNNPYQLARIDSVSALLEEKQSNIQSFLLLKDKEAKNVPLRKALKIIDQKAKDSPTEELVNTLKTSPNRQKANRADYAAQVSSPRHPAPPPSPLPENQTGELLNDVKDIIHDMEHEASQMKQYLGKQELDIIEQDWLIMDQIRSIIKDVRREELSFIKANAAKAHDIATDSVATISTIGGFTLFGCIVFLALVFKDLTRSNYYRSNLIKSKKRAEKLAQAKEEFLANMSHEIRTPLNAITGFLEQLKKTRLDRNQHLFVDTIESSSDHLLSIVNDILDLSKIESGKLAIEERPFTIRKVMQTVVDVMRAQAQEKNITISRELDPALDLTLLGDPHRLRQILFNLVGNAVKFTEQGGVSVRAQVKEATDSHISVEFLVEDTGTGIAHDKLDHIFGAFNQEDGMTGQRFGGTGLGLAISKKLVELHHGWIGVESTVGHGSTFSFLIRYQRSDAPLPLSHEPARPANNVSDTSVLVVDDDHINRLLLEVLSEKWDARVDIVDGGQTALEQISQHDYDIVLADINMPEMSGTELMLKIKEDRPDVPVVAFTATAQSETLDGFLALGFDDYLLKPFKESDLRAKIAQYTTDRSAADVDDISSETVLSESAPGAQVTTPSYSLEELTAITRNSPRKLIDILELILSRCPAEVNKLADASAEQQWSLVAKQAHKLRSSFGQIGAQGLVEDLYRIEVKALETNPDTAAIAQATQRFATQARAVFGSLRRHVQSIAEMV